MALAVQTFDLTKQFGQVLALDRLSLEIPEGSIFGVIGPNGAGKSTLMRLLVDVLKPTSGHVEVLGDDPRSGGKDLRARLGYLPGEFRVEPQLTGRQHLRFWASLSPGRDAMRRGGTSQTASILTSAASRGSCRRATSRNSAWCRLSCTARNCSSWTSPPLVLIR